MAIYRDLVDVQVNGYGGKDFSSSSLCVEDVILVSNLLAERGTAAYVPTLVTSPGEIYRRNIMVIIEAIEQSELCQSMIAGLHIEGPFISAKDGARGAHEARYVSAADRKFMSNILEIGGSLVKLVTVAPEVEHIEELITMVSERDIVVSMGHTLASEKQIERAIQAGASCVTHLGNGIPAQLPRTDNPIFSFLSHEELTIMLITDGHHIPDPFIRTVLRTCGTQRIVVTSDSAPLAGMPAGKYVSLGGNVVLEENGKLHIPTLGCLAGSSACLSDCAAYLDEHKILSEDDILTVTRDNPKRLLGLR